MQPYLWQQAEKYRHVYDTAKWYPIRAGVEFDTLCGITVAPTTKDLIPGLWLDPTCHECERGLAELAGWPPERLEQLRSIQAGRRPGDASDT